MLKRTCALQNGMSALIPIADMCGAKRDVRFVPIADIDRLFNHLVGAPNKCVGDSYAERFSSL